MAEVIIVGGGPAGLSAAMWCADLGLATTLVEREACPGGQLLTVYNPIENYLGIRARDGRDLLRRFSESIDRSSFARRMDSEVIRIDSQAKSVVIADGRELRWKAALIVATGVRRKRLGVPGEAEYQNKGILQSGVRDGHNVKGKRVLIVGGGDAAMENALLLSDFASSVKVVFRKDRLTARDEFRNAAEKKDNIVLLPQTVVTRISGQACVSEVELEDRSASDTRIESVDAVLIRIGVEPNSELVRDISELDEDGYVKVDPTGLTSCSDIYAVGDVANPAAPTISTATGTGATAAKNIYRSFSGKKGI